MYNIYLISFSDSEYDGRLRELKKVFSSIGNLYLYDIGKRENKNSNYVFSKKNYFKFILGAVKYGLNVNKKNGKNTILVLDNRKSIIPGLILRMLLKEKIITVLDCRELYISSEMKSMISKIGCYIEKIGVKKADIIIAANKYRALKMKELYRLTQLPVVFENVRRLQFSSNADFDCLRERYKLFFKDDEIRVISTAGCSVSRTTDILVYNIDKVKKKCRLFLVGDSSVRDEARIKEIINLKKLENVEIIGKVGQDELKFLIQNCHIGIVNYNQIDTNNLYCASGKLYEFIYEGLPVLTTTNPPLRELCCKEKIGCSDDQFFGGINGIIEKYDFYRRNVLKFREKINIEKNNELLTNEILRRIVKINEDI